jgi:signal transduction histidine kinase
LVTVVCVLACFAASLVAIVFDLGPVALAGDRWRVALESALASIAVLATFLVVGRFVRSRSSADRILACALGVLAGTTVWTAMLSVAGWERGVSDAVWKLAAMRFVGGVLFSAAALAHLKRVERWPGPTWLGTILAVLGVGAIVGVGTVVAWPSELPSELAPLIEGTVGVPGGVLVLEWLGAVALVVAAVAFAGSYARSGDLFMLWLAAASAACGLARLNYGMVPTFYLDSLYVGDLFRGVAFVLLLVGALQEIGRYWRGYAMDALVGERRHIARELHDGVAHEALFIADTVRSLAQEDARPELRRVIEAADRAVDETRRAIGSLTRPVGAPLGPMLVEFAEFVADREGARVHAACDPDVRVPAEVSEALARIVRESVTNAVRHGHAGVIDLQLRANGHIQLQVRDDGDGFDPERDVRGFGLISMQERAAMLGGTFTVASAPGEGTTVTVTLAASSPDRDR